MRAVRLAIADDHELFRDGLTLLFASCKDFTIVGHASSSAQAVEVAESQQPDMLLLDVEMGGESASTTIRRVLRVSPVTRITILTMHSDRVLKQELIAAGASAYINKSSAKSELLDTLRAVAKGQHCIAEQRPVDPGGNGHLLLSPRELEVLRRLALAFSNQEIAKALSIAEGTVKRHTGSIYQKLEAHSRMHAVVQAKLLGLLGDD